jgi:alkylation response protein AidB-like acyl-CoA dehydrogenase
VEGGAVRGVGLATFPTRSRALIATVDGAHIVQAGALEVAHTDGIDPRLGLVEVTGSVDLGAPIATTADWSTALAAGQRALAHELVGVSRTMLALAREHALDRVQFDRPIAGFQAVRHRLADSLVAIEAADAAAHAAWDDGTPLTAAMAKAIAGRNARFVARHAQQVLAGIGFTTEHPLHHHVRRALVLDRLLGDARSLTASLGADLLAGRRPPSLLPL